MLYTNTSLLELVEAVGIGRWEEVSSDEVKLVSKGCLEISLERVGEYISLNVFDKDDFVSGDAWFEILEHACSQAVALAQGDIALISGDPTALVWFDAYDFDYIIADDGRHVKAVNDLVEYPLKRVRLHKHDGYYELQSVAGNCRCYRLEQYDGDHFWHIVRPEA